MTRDGCKYTNWSNFESKTVVVKVPKRLLSVSFLPECSGKHLNDKQTGITLIHVRSIPLLQDGEPVGRSSSPVLFKYT